MTWGWRGSEEAKDHWITVCFFSMKNLAWIIGSLEHWSKLELPPHNKPLLQLRTNFLVTTYKLPEIPGSLYVRTNLLKFQEACTYTYKLTKISVSLYVRTNLLDVQTYSNIYIHICILA